MWFKFDDKNETCMDTDCVLYFGKVNAANKERSPSISIMCHNKEHEVLKYINEESRNYDYNRLLQTLNNKK